MKWISYLIFCSSVYGGSVCLAPIQEPNQKVCNFVGDWMRKTSTEAHAENLGGSFHCISVPKDK